MASERPARRDYCQYLVVSQLKYTLSNYADHTQERSSRDTLNRTLREER